MRSGCNVVENVALQCASWLSVLLLLLPAPVTASAEERGTVTVAQNGTGDFRTIQEGLNSIPPTNRKPVIILIRNGLYVEKLWIQKSHVALVGEDRESTHIVYPELREDWVKEHGSDWGSAVVNVDSAVTDVTLANLTVYNNYGWKNGVFNRHQFAIRGGGTRIMLLHCTVKSDGGDAVSLWNRQNGMYYHSDCLFEGWVDYVCPRGWCYITDSEFFGHSLTASIWHDGSSDRRQKLVIADSYFDGVPAFPLGRNHRDGQYFLLNCTFSKHMADKPIYFPSESPNATPWMWGRRQYYSGCHREGGDYAWFNDNLSEAEGSPIAEQITAHWTFDGRWDPEGTMPSVLPFASLPRPKNKSVNIPRVGTRLTWVSGRHAESHIIHFGTSNPPEFRGSQKVNRFEPGDLDSTATYFWRVDEVTAYGVVIGKVWSFKTR